MAVVGVHSDQRAALIAPTPPFHVRSEMDLRLFGHPLGLIRRCHQLARTRDELSGIADAVTTLIVVPPPRHILTLHHGLAAGSVHARPVRHLLLGSTRRLLLEMNGVR